MYNLQAHVGMTSTAVLIASAVGIDRFNVSCLSSAHVRFPQVVLSTYCVRGDVTGTAVPIWPVV